MNYLRFVVSVSSSDRRGVQENRISSLPCWQTGFSILIGSSGGSSSSPSPPPALSGSFSILIGSSGGSSPANGLQAAGGGRKFQYPHRIVGGFKLDSEHEHTSLYVVFQYPHRIVGGFKNVCAATQVRASSMFQYPHRIVGGFKSAVAIGTTKRTLFQYPHRIVGGFKRGPAISDEHQVKVSVSSSDRRGVQVEPNHSRHPALAKFQYPHRIVGGFKYWSAL